MSKVNLLRNPVELIEPEVAALTHYTAEQAGAMSAAISLKRIADALTTCNNYGETGAEAIGNSILRGLRNV